MTMNKLVTALPVSMVLAAGNLFAQIPPNDNFTHAAALPATQAYQIDNATAEPFEPAHDPRVQPSHSLWWNYTPAADTFLTVDTLGSEFDTLLSIYTGASLAELVPLARSDDDPALGNGWSRIRLKVTQGTTYYLAADSVLPVVSGLLTVTTAQHLLSAGAYAENDCFATPSVLSNAVTSGSAVVAGERYLYTTAELSEPAHGGRLASHSLWWLYTAATNGVFSIDMAGSTCNPVCAVYQGDSLGALVPVAGVRGVNTMTFPVVQSATYRMAVDGATDTGTLQFNWRFSEGPSPANDAFAGAAGLSGVSGSMGGVSTVFATSEPGEPAHNGTNAVRSLWWVYTPAADGTLSLNTSGCAFSAATAVYLGASLPSLLSVAVTAFSSNAIQYALMGGMPYYVAVDGKTSDQFGEVNIGWTFLTAATPFNDNFAGAGILATTSGAVCADTATATAEAGEPAHYAGAPSHSLWWTFTAALKGTLVVDTEGSAFDTVLALYAGASLTNLQQLASNDSAGDDAMYSRIEYLLDAGATCHIALDGYSVSDSGGACLNWSFSRFYVAPTDIALSCTQVAEKQPPGTAVGTFSSSDTDVGDSFSYTLAAGSGDADNGAFSVSNGTLRTLASFTNAVKSSYSMRARSTDLGGKWFEKAFTITVPPPPAVTTLAADAVSNAVATLRASVNPNGFSSDAFFQYSTDPGLDAWVATLAGTGGAGSTNGPGNEASLNAPKGVAADGAGNVYVADSSNHRIRKVTPEGDVSTLAGSGVAGFLNGSGSEAKFSSPAGVAVDAAGNVYVADCGNHRIRKITSAGTVSTLAGSGASGSDDGAGSAAAFCSPSGVAVDGAGNVYVADTGNHRIRAVTPAGFVTTLAGSGVSGFADGPGASARFSGPSGVAVDGAGNVYVGDSDNHRIRKVTPAGAVTTLAGTNSPGFADGSGTEARLYNPSGVAVDGAGNVVVADSGNSRIRTVTPAGAVTTLAGSGVSGFADGSGASTRFSAPSGVAADGAGNVYVGDSGNNRVRKIGPQPAFRLAQSGLAGASAVPVSLSVTGLLSGITYYFRASATNGFGAASGGILSFTTTGATNRVPVDITLSSLSLAENQAADTFVATLGTADPDAGDTFTYTLAAGDGDADNGAFGVSNGTLRTSSGFSGAVKGSYSVRIRSTDRAGLRFLKAFTLAVLPAPAVTTLVADAVSQRAATLRASVNPNGVRADALFQYSLVSNLSYVDTLAGTGMTGTNDGSGAVATFSQPYGVALDGAGNLFVADYNNHRIRKVTAAGVVSTVAGSSDSGLADGFGASAKFNNPKSVAVDGAGYVYVAERGNNCIRKIAPSGLVTTLAGTNSAGFADGSGTAARFNNPSGVAVDGAGNVYVADAGNNRIRKISPVGAVTTLAGATGGFRDGTGTNALFSAPTGVALDGAGNVYVGDESNHRVRKITPAGAVTTLAGAGFEGFADGSGAAAWFNHLSGVAVDRGGNVYVADVQNYRIRKVSPSGAVTTLAGSNVGFRDGNGAAALFNMPQSVAVDGAGNVYVADLNNHRIRKVGLPPDVLASGALAQSGLTGSGNVQVSLAVTGLQPSTTYYCRAVTTNGCGFVWGQIVSFATPAYTAPTNLVLSPAQVGDKQPPGTVVGVFSTADADIGDAFSYALVAGMGSADNGLFSVSNGTLTTLACLTNAVRSSYSVRVRTTDLEGLLLEKAFTITVLPPPVVTTLAADAVTFTGGTLHGAVNANGVRVDALFQYSTDPTLGLTVSTLAGSGVAGFTNGSGRQASFKNPLGVAVDGAGNAYVADTDNHRIRKIAPNGAVSTLAGTGEAGFLNGSGSAAKFSSPCGVALDGAGNVYVADANNHRIRKITPSGEVTSLAGSGLRSFSDGTNTVACFNAPSGVVLDGAGNVYVGDSGNNRIRKITPNGTVTTLAGSGTAGSSDGTNTAASFNLPLGVAVDGAGNVFVADMNSHRIRKVAPNGAVTTLAGSSGGYADGSGTAAKFFYPYGLTLDSTGHVYVADTFNSRIRRITAEGAVTTVTGNSYDFQDGPLPTARFRNPGGLAMDAAGNIYVADTNNERIRMIGPPPGMLAQSGVTGVGDVQVSLALTGLQPGANYYYRVLLTNESGTVYGPILSFSTPAYTAPTGLTLSPSQVAEKQPPGTVVGTFSTADADSGDAFVYTLVSGTGSTDNGAFSVSNGTLRTLASFTNAVKSSYSVRARSTDLGGLWFEKAFVIAVAVTPAITTLEADAVSSTVATLHASVNPNGVRADAFFQYSTNVNLSTFVTVLAQGGVTGSGEVQVSKALTDLQPGTNYYFRSMVTNVYGTFYGQILSFDTTVVSANRAPTNIVLSASGVAENQPSGSLVGTLSATDPDVADTFTYTLVAGTGSADNGSFSISGNALLTFASFNFESKSSYSIRIRATDQGGLWYEKAFTITVSDVVEPAPAIVAIETAGTGGVPVIRWTSIANHLYTVYQSTNLLTGFTVQQAGLPASPPFNSYTGAVDGVRAKFWKVSTGE